MASNSDKRSHVKTRDNRKWVVSNFCVHRAWTGNVFHDAGWLIEEYKERGAEVYLNDKGDSLIVEHPAYGIVDTLCVVDIHGNLLDPSPM